jgi:hypothetical protein
LASELSYLPYEKRNLTGKEGNDKEFLSRKESSYNATFNKTKA